MPSKAAELRELPDDELLARIATVLREREIEAELDAIAAAEPEEDQ